MHAHQRARRRRRHRLSRCVSIVTGAEGPLPRVKPFKYTYEKEIGAPRGGSLVGASTAAALNARSYSRLPVSTLVADSLSASLSRPAPIHVHTRTRKRTPAHAPTAVMYAYFKRVD